ncbi:MAG: hypothetical protein KKA16_05285 [Alphaproteobacteria bacterium]|nr:hypothetical protein [Alphaproteobacteria bacterium]MBU2380276.1 hypothetical protein [Alphaproteobacteria bacterium]
MQVERQVVLRGVDALHAILLSFPIALFTAALVTDIAYLNTAQVQWTNFSAWLITGALFFGGLVAAWALVWALLSLKSPRMISRWVYFGLLAGMWVLGLINAFKHSQDAWSSVGAFGLFLSILCTILAMAAGAVLHFGFWTREVDQ